MLPRGVVGNGWYCRPSEFEFEFEFDCIVHLLYAEIYFLFRFFEVISAVMRFALFRVF